MPSDPMNVVYEHNGVLSWTTIQPEKLNRLRINGELTVRIVAEGVTAEEAIQICRQQSGMSVGLMVLDQIKENLLGQDTYFVNALFALRTSINERHAMIQTVETVNSLINGRAIAEDTIKKIDGDPLRRFHYLELGLVACKYNAKALVAYLDIIVPTLRS